MCFDNLKGFLLFFDFTIITIYNFSVDRFLSLLFAKIIGSIGEMQFIFSEYILNILIRIIHFNHFDTKVTIIRFVDHINLVSHKN